MLDLSEFYKRGDGYENYVCITCINKRHKEYRDKMRNNLQWRVRQSELTKQYYQRKKKRNETDSSTVVIQLCV